MISVSKSTKSAWLNENAHKDFKIICGSAEIYNSSIEDSISVSYDILASDSLEFVGGIAASCEITTDALNTENLKGKDIKLLVRADNTEWIPLFSGFIEEVSKLGMRGLKTIKAYDLFYKLSKVDATDWINSIGQMTIASVFEKFCGNYNIPVNRLKCTFVNSNRIFYGSTKKQIKGLTALDFIKQLCQINGCMGVINREGLFETVYIQAVTQQRIYPQDSLFPSGSIFPSDYEGEDESGTSVPYYQSLQYEDYTVNTIDKTTIRNTASDEGVSYPYSGVNTYIIQGNVFSIGQTGTDTLEMAKKIYIVSRNASFRPFSSKQPCMPWLECGDNIKFYDIDDEGEQISFETVIMSHRISGNNMLWSEMSASAEREQSIFITDLSAQIEDLQNQIDDLKEDSSDGSIHGIVTVEYTVPIEQPTLGGIEDSVSGIVTEV